MTNKSLVWLAPHGTTDGLKRLGERYMRQAGLTFPMVRQIQMPSQSWQRRTKTIWQANPDYAPQFFRQLAAYQPTHILVNDRAALEYLTGRYNSLAQCRGSVYEWTNPATHQIIPCIVIDDIRKTHSLDYAGFCLLNDLLKAKRWYDGKPRSEPAFQLRVISHVSELDELAAAVDNSILVAMDIETTGTGAKGLITCDGYTTWEKDGTLISWVVPFIDPTKPGNRYWQSEEDEVQVHTRLRAINATPVPKVLQNGQYDCHYYIRYRRPPRNFLFDTAVAWHAIWPEIPKRIDFICSIGVDHYRYWKDEHKEEDKTDKKGAVRVPQTAAGLQAYWRYNGLDTYYTALAAHYCFGLLSKPELEWARHNYTVSMRQTIGPAACKSMTGVRVNRELQKEMAERNRQAAESGRKAIRAMAANPEFNPNSPAQVASLLYDVWKAKPQTRGKYKGRSTNEVALKLVQTQSPLIARIIESLWDAKKPANNISKYGPYYHDDKGKPHGLRLWNGRWYYTQNAIGTETGRYSSSESNYWLGTQIQNPPYAIRNMVEADDGYWLFNADYSQSDNWYTAYQSGEPNMIAAVTSDKDTHCMHAAQFFQKPYEEIYDGYKADDPKITDSTTGIRQVTKRVVYGANYLMAAYTLFLTMGRRAVVGAAKALGLQNPEGWNQDQLIALCQHFLDIYFGQMYPGLKPWLESDARQVAKSGNRAVCGFGRTRTFFGDVADTKSPAHRELAAFYGQGGTAGCINLALDRIYWQSDFYSQGGILLFQMHDSIAGLVPIGRFDLLDLVLDCMQNPCTINGRTFTVPVEIDVGLGWGKRMCRYEPGITTAADVQAANDKWMGKWQTAA